MGFFMTEARKPTRQRRSCLLIAESVLEDDPVTSTVPSLSRPTSYLTQRRESSPGWSGQPDRIHWPVIFASATVSFALVAGVFAWIATHPHKAPQPLQSASVTVVELLAAVREPQAPPRVPVFSAIPVFHHTASPEIISSNVPLEEVNSPPLPAPAHAQPKPQRSDNAEWMAPWQLPQTPKEPAGETYGTQVLFFNNQEAAGDKARHEHKLMFVIHISGNFEDSCFT